MINYNNSVIYKLCSKDINIKEIYVGSTANNLRVRKGQHKTVCNNINSKKYNYYVYQFIRNNGGFDNWDIVEIERCNCNDKQELHKRERFYIELLESSLNMVIPNRSNKQWREDNKELLIEKKKEYYEDNKDKIAEQKKQHYKDNKEQILEKQKEYYEKNKDKYAEKDKERYEKNKDKINEKRREKVECDICNKIMSRGCLTRHKKNLHNK